MRKVDFFLLFILILFAFSLRFIFLGSVPQGFHIDEVRVGYNAYSILKTGRDENGNFLPLFYNSFKEYRPTGYFYSTIPFILISGLSEQAVRSAGAIYGVLSILVFWLLVLETTGKRRVAFYSAFFLTFSSWHILLSRASSEAVGSLFWGLLGIYFLFVYLKKEKITFFIFSLIFLIFSFLFYPSARIIIPFVVLIIFLSIENNSLKKTVWLMFFILSIISYLFLSILSGGNNRLQQVVFIKNPQLTNLIEGLIYDEGEKNILKARIFHNKIIVYSKDFLYRYLNYLSPQFLISPEIKPDRYGFTTGSLITISEYLLTILGLYNFKKVRNGCFFLVFLLIAVIPAALTYEDSPNMQRAIFMLPPIVLFSAIGIFSLEKFSKNKYYLILIILSYILELTLFLHLYFNHQRSYRPFSRNEKSKEVVLKLLSNKDNYDEIIITNTPDNHYLYLLFFGKYDPVKVRGLLKKNESYMQFDKFFFSQEACPSNLIETGQINKKALIVDSGDCPLIKKNGLNLKGEVFYSNGARAYSFLEYNPR